MTTTTINWTLLATTLPQPSDFKAPLEGHSMSGQPAADIYAAHPATVLRTEGFDPTPVILVSHRIVDGLYSGRVVAEMTEAEFNGLSQGQLDHLVDDGNAYWACLPVNELDGAVVQPPTSVFNHLVNRTQIVETVNGVESVLANYDYDVEPFGEQFAQGYIDTFGGTRDLRIAYFAEIDTPTNPLASFAVVEELLDGNNQPYEKVIEVKTTETAANGYVGIFSGGTRILRVARLEETTQPVA